ncbi:MAG TPA: Ig-like domain-containing protein [Candidatus Aquilonibacter sp.]|nr:Ig-like domain-containing protein [Candidatus Aquilonibacter sp.]
MDRIAPDFLFSRGKSRQLEGGSKRAGRYSGFVSTLALLVSLGAGSGAAAAQVSVTTYHNDNARTGQNTVESFLSPANVNSNQFGKLFTGSVNLDSWSAAQPLYVPNVFIGGLAHNVVYVATINNSVYAFDADSGSLLWTNNYGPATPFANLCQDSQYENSPSGGAGIVSTPVIDPVASVIYFVTKTGDGNSSPFGLYLHAVDITTGFDKVGSPVLIVPPSGPAFLPEYHMSRPGLLLNNGMVYVALASTGCKGLSNFPSINNHGWVLGYSTASLNATPAVFVTTPNTDNGGIWQSGGGLAADSQGNIYFETADAAFDVNTGGGDFGNSVIKLNSSLGLADYFTPYNQGTLLNPQDLDLSSVGPILLPDQPDGPTHLLVASGKAEEIYLINRDSMGGYCSTCSSNTNIVQDVTAPSWLTGCLKVNNVRTCSFGSPSFWNDNLYFPGSIAPLLQYTISDNGGGATVESSPSAQTTGTFTGVGPVSVSSNGTSDGIVWSITWGSGQGNQYNGNLHAFDANNVATEFYNSNQAANQRDTLGNIAKYATPTIANGKVYAATQTQLVVYGLLSPLSPSGGNRQNGAVNSTLPLPLTVQAANPYTGGPLSGVAVTFSDSNAGGSFGTPSVITDSNGKATTTYTLPKKAGVVSITVSGSTAVSTVLNVSATAGPVTKIALVSGGSQSGAVNNPLAQPIVVSAKDSFGNLIPGVAITFSDGGAGGSFSANPVPTGANGRASVSYTVPTKATNISIKASSSNISLLLSAKSLPGAPASVNYVSGNHQSAPPNTMLPNPLVVSVKDQYNNLIAGATVTFADNGVHGTFSSNGSVTTGSNGRASITYATGSQQGNINISATTTTLPSVLFVETVN